MLVINHIGFINNSIGRSYPLRMVLADLQKAGDVVGEIRESHASLGSYNPYTTEDHSSHTSLNKSEDVFYSRTHP